MQSHVEEVQYLVAPEQLALHRCSGSVTGGMPTGRSAPSRSSGAPSFGTREDAGDPDRSGLGGELDDEGVEEVRGGGAGGRELGVQRIHQGHQLVHLRYDATLFG